MALAVSLVSPDTTRYERGFLVASDTAVKVLHRRRSRYWSDGSRQWDQDGTGTTSGSCFKPKRGGD
jgi:hypothetical protein